MDVRKILKIVRGKGYFLCFRNHRKGSDSETEKPMQAKVHEKLFIHQESSHYIFSSVKPFDNRLGEPK